MVRLQTTVRCLRARRRRVHEAARKIAQGEMEAENRQSRRRAAVQLQAMVRARRERLAWPERRALLQRAAAALKEAMAAFELLTLPVDGGGVRWKELLGDAALASPVSAGRRQTAQTAQAAGVSPVTFRGLDELELHVDTQETVPVPVTSTVVERPGEVATPQAQVQPAPAGEGWQVRVVPARSGGRQRKEARERAQAQRERQAGAMYLAAALKESLVYMESIESESREWGERQRREAEEARQLAAAILTSSREDAQQAEEPTPPPEEETTEEERQFNELCSAAGVLPDDIQRMCGIEAVPPSVSSRARDDERREAAFKKRCRSVGITVAVHGGRGQGGGQSQQDARLEADRLKATSLMTQRLGEGWREKAEQNFASRR